MSQLTLQPFVRFDDNIRPPKYEHHLENGYIEPPLQQIVSWRDGIVLSRYGDNQWDLTPYSKKKNIIHFDKMINTLLRAEAKRLIYLYMTHGNGKGKTLPGGASIINKFYAIQFMCEYADGKGKSLEEVLSNTRLFKSFIAYLGRSRPNYAMFIKTITTLLNRLSVERSGFSYTRNKVNEKLLNSITTKYMDSLEQTLLIPVSIYASAAKMRWEHISLVEKNLKGLVKFLSEYVNHRGFGLVSPRDLTEEEMMYHIPWKKAVKKYQLQKLFNKYQVTSNVNVPSFINKLQSTCRHLIHQYTGMRDNECRQLTYDCWHEKTSQMPSRIFGYESKIHGVKTPQVWITHDEIKRVIDILNAIAKPMYEAYCPHLEIRPLMIRTGFMNLSLDTTAYNDVLPNELSDLDELPLDIVGITISKEHIEEELKAIEPMRNWDEHKWIRERVQWQFSSHQYRRSLAVYALSSGLVSLHAIKEQFGHLISTMTAYYGNGYKSARRLDGRTDNHEHIANYIQRNKHIIEALSYQKNILLGKSPLWGPNGLHLEKHIVAKTPEERQSVMLKTPQLIKKFKNGILHYHETVMGGCTTSDPCEKFLLPDFFISCKGCDHSIHMLAKIERLSEKQRRNAMKWAERAPDSIEHRTAVQRSIAINEFRDMLRRKEEKLKEEIV